VKTKNILLICSFIFGAPTICFSMDLSKVPSLDESSNLSTISGMCPLKFSFVANNGKRVEAVTNPVLTEGSDNAHTCLLYSLYNVIFFEKLAKLNKCFSLMGDAKKSFPIIRKWKDLLKENGWDGNSGPGRDNVEKTLLPKCDILPGVSERGSGE